MFSGQNPIGFAADVFLTTLLIISSPSSSFFLKTEDMDYPSVAYPPKSWINVPTFWGSTGLSLILITSKFICGFHCQDAQQVHFELKIGEHKVEYVKGRFGPFVLPSTSASQFIQLRSDGHLRAYK
ncbi:hypothetical protein PTKIN_Ptkin07bG0022800 [Pterospermum kingtungense]